MSTLKIVLISLASIPITIILNSAWVFLFPSHSLADVPRLFFFPIFEIPAVFVLVFLTLSVANKKISKIFLVLYLLTAMIVFYVLFMMR
ncbi:hypothetical protein A3A60_02840 [Candidatus Curtissbacteria bacterium RIFCSPLOWO2_01_FULL_42_26]|uniref:Uncharacterized protein n=1 Tax=Candidatus Curtissbacteria bacterium RIFCSPLOWO2_01_FULL_42_26 TaxID=1797729 RepID=A0A1F5HXJ8_9BACT|nr:MAG: hypothetical protein A3A60_02840 [Candidatus Curtissbacteria bacterium RIFCSPLOWO2_01_FULL_42_26]